VTDHDHPEIEDRVTAELIVIRTELGELRQEVRSGFDRIGTVLGSIGTVLDSHNKKFDRIGNALDAQSVVLKAILEVLER
jgi:hypothetical protein